MDKRMDKKNRKARVRLCEGRGRPPAAISGHVRQVRSAYERGWSIDQICWRFGFSNTTVYRMIKGEGPYCEWEPCSSFPRSRRSITEKTTTDSQDAVIAALRRLGFSGRTVARALGLGYSVARRAWRESGKSRLASDQRPAVWIDPPPLPAVVLFSATSRGEHLTMPVGHATASDLAVLRRPEAVPEIIHNLDDPALWALLEEDGRARIMRRSEWVG